MGYPRSFLVDVLVGGVYHCVSRCARRESLIESRERCAWLVERFKRLARILAIDVCDFAVMRNHVHLLLRTHPELALAWSDEEVVRRWLSVAFLGVAGGVAGGVEGAEPAQADVDAALADPALVAEWRARLSDLGWFHKLWKEPAAKAWNREDAVAGHFWQGRYRSVGCADESAILMQATYILLNPVHCGLDSELVDSPRTSTGRRLKALMRSIEAGGHREGVAAYETALLEPAIPCDPGTEIPRLSDAEWSRRLAERTYERALRENAVEDARRAADRARRFDKGALDAQKPEAEAETVESAGDPVSSPGAAENEAPSRPTGTAPARLLVRGARLLRSRTPTMPKRRIPDPPSSGNVAKRVNPWRERSTLPMIQGGDGCTLLAFVEFLGDRGRVERPDKSGRIDPAAPRAVDRLLAQAGVRGRSDRPEPRRRPDPSAAREPHPLAEARTLLDDAESAIREILAGATGPPRQAKPGDAPSIAWRGTIIGSAEAADREAERRGTRGAEPLRPLAANMDAITA